MTVTATEPLRIISRLDLSPARDRLQLLGDDPGWQRQITNEAEIEYRRYLTLCALESEVVLPAGSFLERFWEAHAADSSQYDLDCQRIFGAAFMPHREDGVAELDRSEELYRLHFKRPVPDVWRVGTYDQDRYPAPTPGSS